MWGLWFFPLITLCFFAGLAIAVVWFLVRAGVGKRPKPHVAVATGIGLPLGCAALPVVAFIVAAAVSPLFQKSDAQLYEEIFGYATTLGEDRMLSNDQGRGANRQIFMRAEPAAAERAKMLAIPGLHASATTLDEFATIGTVQGFSWWMSNKPQHPDLCRSARIHEAPGFRGWRDFRIAECLEGGPDFPANTNSQYVYIVASGKSLQ